MSTARTPVPFTTPPGRLVWGSVHKSRLQKDDRTGQPKKIKSGDSAGQDLYMYQFGIAVPKTKPRWQDETFTDGAGRVQAWGNAIYSEGVAAWPRGEHQRDDFAWKVTDGDSTKPNKKMKRPCDQAGYAGCWVLSFSGITAPQIFSTLDGGSPKASTVQDLINPGDYIQINGSVVSNGSDQTSGVYLNHAAVCMRGYGERIVVAADADTSAFGSGAVDGGSSTPVAANMSAAAGAPPTPPAPAPAAPAVPVVPNANYAPSAPARERMVHKDGQSFTYASMRAQNWTDALMAQNEYTIDPA